MKPSECTPGRSCYFVHKRRGVPLDKDPVFIYPARIGPHGVTDSLVHIEPVLDGPRWQTGGLQPLAWVFPTLDEAYLDVVEWAHGLDAHDAIPIIDRNRSLLLEDPSDMSHDDHLEIPE